MNAADSSVMMFREEGGFLRELSALLQRDAASADREEILQRHDQPDLGDANVFGATNFAPDLVADGVDLVANDLMVAKVVHMGGLHWIKLDNFHCSFSPAPSLADRDACTTQAGEKLNFSIRSHGTISGVSDASLTRSGRCVPAMFKTEHEDYA